MGEHVIDGNTFSIASEEDISWEEYVSTKPNNVKRWHVSLENANVVVLDDLNALRATLTRPNQHEESLVLSSTPHKTVELTFTSHEAGLHLVNVTKCGIPVDGSPFQVVIEDDITWKEYLLAAHGPPNPSQIWQVDFDNIHISLPEDRGTLCVSVSRPNGKEEPLACYCTPQNTLSLTFVSKEPGEYLVHVAKHGQPVNGSPFVILIEEDVLMRGEDVNSITDGVFYENDFDKDVNVDFDFPGIILPDDFPMLCATITRPNGERESMEFSCTSIDTLGLTFSSSEAGKHVIDITREGVPIEGSPVCVMVEEENVTE